MNNSEKMNPANKDSWFKIFKSYVNVCSKFYEDKKYDECIELGRETVEIYEQLVGQLKSERILKRADLEIAQNKFSDNEKAKNFQNTKYKELETIKTLCAYIALSYRNKAEEAYSAKDYMKALKLSKQALLYSPTEVLVNFTLAKTLVMLKANKEAADAYETVMRYDKNYNEGRRLLAELYKSNDLQDYDKCILNYSRYLKEAKDDKNSWYHYSGQCYKLGLHEECKKACEQVMKLNPTFYNSIIVYMLNLLKIDGYDQKSINRITHRLVEKYIKATGIKKYVFDFEKRNKDPNRKLKIGYLSSDLYNHVVSRFLVPIIEHHNKEKFEIFMYTVTSKRDGVTEKYQKAADHFESCHQMTNDELAKKIYDDKIDILIDLNGHTGDARTIIMAQKPAPIQGVYLGYPNTSGIDTVDYILTDKDTILPGEECFYTEKPAYIDAGYEVINPDYSTLPEITEAPYIKNKYVTMGVFNATAKVTEEMIKIWAYILKNTKKSKILFQYINHYTEENQKRILAEFEKYGIKKDRVMFFGRAQSSHYDSIAKADFALDTFPYSGTGTTMDCILMGLPIVCVEGYHSTSRPTGRILRAINEEALISEDFNGYAQTAINLIKNPALISKYRSKLRNKLQSSKLTDYEGFTRSLENTYKKMWEDYCSSKLSIE